MELTFCLFLLPPLLGNVVGQDMHFIGGSMSFKFIDTTNTPYKLKITAVTGWVIGMGPCGTTCNAGDISRSTKTTRKDVTESKGVDYFGKWLKEISLSENDKRYEDLTSTTVNKIDGFVAAINAPMKWEQEIAEVVIDIDPSTVYTDISLSGRSWRWFNYTEDGKNEAVDYRLQIKVIPAPRDETKKPNNSPVAIFKPVYKIKLNTKTTIKLSTMDHDGDILKCIYAEFVEAGGLGRLKNTIVNSDCSIEIDAQESAGFVDGGWGAIPVKLMDFASNLKIDDSTVILPNALNLGAINIQFMIQTLKTIYAPAFVDPTVESQHEFNVFVGSTLTIYLYAKPMESSNCDIDSFYLTSIPPRKFTLGPLLDDPNRTDERVKYSSMNWRPGKSEVGGYLFRAIVIDTDGSDGIDRNYNIIVKDMELLPEKDPPHRGPYFPVFPNITGIVCMINSTCSFPIYTNTKTPSASVSDLKDTTSTFITTTISKPEAINKDGKHMFVSNVLVHASKGGEQRICFEATDSKGKTSDIKCLGVNVKQPDPCKSNPCINGICTSNGQIYGCKCSKKFTGINCESAIDFCASTPCLNNGICTQVENKNYACDCAGTGHLGLHCEQDIVDCKLGVCGSHGVCRDLDGGFECDCYKGYHGPHCENVDTQCNGVSCKNGGICIEEGGVGVCKCPLGFAEPDCKDKHASPPVTSGIKDNPFTVPSLHNGGEIQCFVGSACLIPVYTKIPTSGPTDVHIGLHSSMITVAVGSPTPDPSTDTVKSIINAQATTQGEHTFCVHSGRTNQDTLCYKVNAVEYPGPLDKKTIPRFLPPTLPDHSIINCIKGKPCHAIFTTKKNPFTNNCTLFSGSTSAIVFKGLIDGQTCTTNVLFNPPTTGDKEVCLQSGPFMPLPPAIFQGERRCYTVKTSTDDCDQSSCTPSHGGECIIQPGETPLCICPKTATGKSCQYTNPCLSTPCKNGGFCEAKGSNYECKCPVGYEGNDCDEITPTTEAEFTDPSMKNGATIQCEVGKKCTIPLFTNGPRTELFKGPTDGDVDVKLTEVVGKAGLNINEGQLVVTPNTAGDKQVCVKTKSSTTQSKDILCYHIKTMAQGKLTFGSDNFKSPSLPDGSVLKCPMETQCHLIMHSKPDGSKCPQVKDAVVGEIGYHIFTTKLEAGSCVTDVVVEPSSGNGLQQLCLKARPKDMQRCFKIDPDKTDPCTTDFCGSYGNCIVEPDHRAACVCDDTHRGDTCGESAACRSSPCKNNAVCEETEVTFKCHCSVGYTDTHCDKRTDVPSSAKPAFTNAIVSSGSTFNCVKDQVCKIPISISNPDAQRPILEAGPHDKGIDVTVPKRPSRDNDIPGRSDLYKGLVDVTPSESGDKKVCVHTGHTSTTGDSERDDTVCYHLHVTDTGTTPPDSFQEPTPTEGSELRCVPTEDCHFLVHSTLKDGECPQVEASGDKANVFPSRKDETFKHCITDVSVSASELTGSSKTICLKARTDTPKRCFQIRPKPSTDPCTAKGCDTDKGACILETDNSASCVCDSTTDSCSLNKCENGGKEDSNHDCQCKLGYSGTTCTVAPQENTDIKPKYADNNVANGGTIKCIRDQKCTFPVYAQGGKGDTSPPKVSPGVTSPGVDVSVGNTPTSLTPSTGVPGLYSASVSVNAHKEGRNKVCLKLEQADKDSVCYNIQVETGGSSATTKFQEPTLPSGSSIPCKTEECHLIVHTKADQDCEQVTSTEDYATVFETKQEGTECITDVMYKPDSTSKDLCIQAGNTPTDKRCYRVQKTTTDPCDHKACQNEGKCLNNGVDAECVCKPGYSGTNCETELDKCKNGGKQDSNHDCHCKLGYSGATCTDAPKENTDSKPKYADNNVANGGTIKCIRNQKCTFPVYSQIGKGGTSPPKVSPGVTSPGVDVSVGNTPTSLTPSTGVPGLYSASVSVNANKEGRNKVCLKLEQADKESVCYNIQVDNPTAGASGPSAMTKFKEPTLPSGSSIPCKTEECHLIVHTKAEPDCEQVTSTEDYVTVFETKQNGIECITDVMYKPDSTSKDLCIQAGTQATDKRCYHVQKTTTDLCDHKTCQNGGECLNNGADADCVCKLGYSGEDCQTALNKCENGGKEDSNHNCQCKLGYSGTTCTDAPKENTDSKPKYADNNVANGGTIKCIQDQKCIFPVYAQGGKGGTSPPKVSPGVTSPGVDVSVGNTPTSLTPSTGVPGLYSASVSVNANKEGRNKVCLKLEQADKGSVCYNIQVEKPKAEAGGPSATNFQEPTLPSGSSIPCKTEECHLIVHTKADPDCEQVTSTEDYATVFKTKQGGTECITDVMYKPDSTSKELCIQAGIPSDERCYHVQKTTTTDPCDHKTCDNGGECLNNGADADCVCKPGYSGTICEKDPGSCLNDGFDDGSGTCQCKLGYSGLDCSQGPGGNPENKPKFADNNMANGGTIQCRKDEKCTFPVYTHSPKGGTSPPKVSPGVTSPGVDVSVGNTPTSLTPSTGVPGLYSASVSVNANKEGRNKVCLKLEEADTKSVCYNIEVTDGSTPTTSTKFISPTLPEGSQMKCGTDVCHLLVHTKKDTNCDQVTTSSGAEVAFPTKEEAAECITDIMYKPTTTSKELCIESGSPADQRCYQVEKSTDPCAYKTCSQDSACLDSGPQAECVCKPGTTGTSCETVLDKCVNDGKEDDTGKCKCPLGYSGETCDIGPTENTDTKPNFADSNMLNGGTIKCEKNEECTFPIYTEVPNIDHSSPLVSKGPSSPDVEVHVNQGTDVDKTTDVPGHYKTPVTITPHESGSSKVCLELSKADEKSVCYNIDVTDGSSKPKQATFLKPTLPDESSVLCKTECHMLVHTKPDPECKQVTTTDSTDTVFDTKKVGTECVTDILYKPGPTDKKLCINSGSHSEQRCYHVKKSTVDPCLSKTCNNDGACVNEGFNGECVCTPGFEGESCEKNQGACNNGGQLTTSGKCVCPMGFTTARCKTAVAKNTGAEVEFANSNLENGGTIKCITGKPCTFPIEALAKDGSNNAPSLSTGPTSGDIHVNIDTPQPIGDKTKVPDMFSIPVTITATEPGIKKLCLKLDDGKKTGVCYSVDVGNEVNPHAGGAVEPKFLTPTLPAGSIVPCKDEHCHMIVHTKPDSSGCKQVSTDNDENKVFTTVPSTDGNKCLTDVAFSKEATAGSQLCINAGNAGEERCYSVKNSNKFTDPCKTETCSDHGMCLRKEADAECVCDEGYTGDTCQTSVAKSIGVDNEKPHIIEPTVSSGSILQCVDGEPCKIHVVATSGAAGSTLTKPEVDGSTTSPGSWTKVPGSQDKYFTDVTIPMQPGPTNPQHCITLKTASGDVGEPWCVIVTRPISSPGPDGFKEPTLPDGSVIPCTIGTTCTIPVITPPGETLKNPTGIDVPHTVEKDKTNPNGENIKITPSDHDKGDHEVCVEMTISPGKRCYKVRVQQNPDSLAKEGAGVNPESKKDGTSTPDASSTQLTTPKVIGPSPMNGTTVTCDSAGCHLKLIVETPEATTEGQLDVKPTGTSGAISKLTSTKISPKQHVIDVTLKPDPNGPDHQTMCMEVTMPSTKSSPWCVDVNVDKSGSPPGSSTTPAEVTEPIVPCHIGSTCLIPVTTPSTLPLLTSPDKSASVQGSSLSPDGHSFTHTVAVTPTSSMPSIQQICLEGKASPSETATVQKCINIEVLPEVKPTAPEVKPTEPSKVISQGLGVDTREPHVLKPTLSSGTVIPCETSCQVEVVVDPGNNPDCGVELIPSKGTFKPPHFIATSDGKYKTTLDITPDPPINGLQPVCFKVQNSGTGTIGDEWCANLNPIPDKSKNPSTSSGSTGKDILSTSLPANTELTCTVDTTCSVDIKTAPGAGVPVTSTGSLNPTVTTDNTDPHTHTLSVTPSKDQVGEHKVCVKVKSDNLCYTMKVTPNPKDIGNKGDGSSSNNPDVPCGANDHMKIVGPTDSSTVDCSSTGCSFHVLVKPPACSKGKVVKIHPETPGQITQGPVSSVGSLKDILVTVPAHSGTPSEEVCMSPDTDPSLPGGASRYCVTLDRSTPSTESTDGNIATPKLVKCELNSECVIPVATSPDRLLHSKPEYDLLAPTITHGQTLQPVVYHAISPGSRTLCIDVAKLSDSGDVKQICTTIEVTSSDSQCSSKPLSKTIAMKSYSRGGMVCTCKNGAVKAVMKPPVSNGELLRVAGLGFGGGVGILAIGALVYLAVTKVKSMSKEKSKEEMYDMDYK